ncbi:MAG: hypothetical protein ACLU9S_20465 [Oscillospiraceae bacterium]
MPTQSGSLTYDGTAKSPTWSDYSSAVLTLGGVTSGTNAGAYTATFTPTANSSVVRRLHKAPRTPPEYQPSCIGVHAAPPQSGSLTYTGPSSLPNSSQLQLRCADLVRHQRRERRNYRLRSPRRQTISGPAEAPARRA